MWLTLLGDVFQQRPAQPPGVEDLCTFPGHRLQGVGQCGPGERVLRLQGLRPIEEELSGSRGSVRAGLGPEGGLQGLSGSLGPCTAAAWSGVLRGWGGHRGGRFSRTGWGGHLSPHSSPCPGRTRSPVRPLSTQSLSAPRSQEDLARGLARWAGGGQSRPASPILPAQRA